MATTRNKKAAASKKPTPAKANASRSSKYKQPRRSTNNRRGRPEKEPDDVSIASSQASDRTEASEKLKSLPKSESEMRLIVENHDNRQKLAHMAALMDQIATNGNARAIAKKAMKPEMMKIIEKSIRQYLWTKIKFCPPDKEAAYVKKVYKLVKAELGDADDNHDSLMSWDDTYSDYCLTALNGVRTYVQTQLGQAAFTWIKDHKTDDLDYEVDEDTTEGTDDFDPTTSTVLPPVADLERCLKRDLDLNTKYDEELFLWYVDCFLPLSTASAKIFTPAQRYYAVLSEAGPADSNEDRAMPTSTEAFAVLAFANNRSKWIWFYRLKQAFDGEDASLFPAKYLKNSGGKVLGATGQWEKSDKGYRVYGVHSSGFYSKNDAGQSKFGGWTKAGLDKFNEYRAMAKEGRAKEDNNVLEDIIKGIMRTKHRITAHSARAQAALTNNTGVPAGVGEQVGACAFYALSVIIIMMSS